MTVIDFLSSPDYLWIITNWNSVWNILAFFSRLWKFVTLQSYFQLAESGVLAYEEQASTTWSTHSSIESSSRRALPRPPSVRHVFGRFPLSFLKRVQYIIAVTTNAGFKDGHLKSAECLIKVYTCWRGVKLSAGSATYCPFSLLKILFAGRVCAQ